MLIPLVLLSLAALGVAVSAVSYWASTHGPRVARFRARIRIVRRLTARAPKRVRIVVIVLAVYLISPLDIIPNFIPGLGVIDDLIVLGTVTWYVRRHDPELARAIGNLIR